MPPGARLAVLEDPSGRRRRRLRFAGRAVALVLTAWLCALALGAVGLSPVSGIPFSHALRPATAPPQVKRLPAPREPTAADLAAARPVRASAVRSPSPPSASPRLGTPGPHGHTVTPAGRPVKAQPHGSAPGKATAPGLGTTTQPSHTTHPNNGRGKGSQTSTSTTTTTTSPSPTTGGRSGSAPGHTGDTPGLTRGSGATLATAP